MVNNKKKKIVVIGLDGGDLNIIKSLIKEGKLPNIEKVMKNGIYGKLKSTIPAVTIPAWPAMFSGKHAGSLEVVHFCRLEKDYKMTVFHSSHWKQSMLWTLIGKKGLKSGIIEVPGTHPVYEIQGFMISPYFSGKDILQNECSTINLPEVKLDVRSSENCATNSQILKVAIHNFKEMTKMVRKLLSEKYWNLFIWVIQITDQAIHLGGIKDIERAYVIADECLADIIRKAEENEWYIMITSDHGVREVKKRFNVNVFLERVGYLEFEKKISLARQLLGYLYEHYLFRSILRALYRIQRRVRSKPLIFKTVFNPKLLGQMVSIKWDKTKAFALTDSISNFMGIWLNTTDNFSKGVVSSEEAPHIKRNIIRNLEEFKDNGVSPVRKVWTKEELYPNVSSRYIPDFFVETKKSYSPHIRQFTKIVNFANRYIHDPYGVFMGFGPDMKEGEELEGMEIIDITPTILHILGIPIPSDVDGKVRKEIFKTDSECLRRKVRYEVAGAGEEEEEGGFSKEDEEKIKKKLRNLGYLA